MSRRTSNSPADSAGHTDPKSVVNPMEASGSGFTVEPDTLRALATGLTNLGGTLDTIHDGREQLGIAVSAPSFDHNGLERTFNDAAKALVDFAGNWSNGIDKFKKDADTVSTALSSAADAYSQTDSSLAQAVSPKSS